MYASDHFTRDLAISIQRDVKDPNRRSQQLKDLYRRFNAREVHFEGRIVGWVVGGKQFVCFKKTYKTEQEAKLIVDMGSVRSRGRHKAIQVYKCPKCDGWHATSQGHMAGKKTIH